jgi:predicted Zn-dependent protease
MVAVTRKEVKEKEKAINIARTTVEATKIATTIAMVVATSPRVVVVTRREVKEKAINIARTAVEATKVATMIVMVTAGSPRAVLAATGAPVPEVPLACRALSPQRLLSPQ